MVWHAAAQADAIGDDEVVGVKIKGCDIAVCRVDGEFYALHNVCTHQYALLSDGFLEDGCLECPLHQGRFDVRSGKPLGPPVTKAVQTYPVKVEGGQVFVDVE